MSSNDHICRHLIVALAILFVSSPILDHVVGSATIDSYLTAGFLLFALYEITRRRADVVIGPVFSSIYGFISLTDPGAFAYSDPLAARLAADHGGQRSTVFTYFSFVTMSTSGYGDIAPVSGLARNFAWIQAVLEQLYLAITVAALVGIHIARGRNCVGLRR